MTRLATGKLRPLLVVLLASATIVIGNSFRTSDDCANPEALFEAAAIPDSEGVEEHRHRYHRSIFQWTEGSIAGTELRFGVLRARTPNDLAFSPTTFVRPRMAPDRESFAWVETEGGPLPVHFAAGSLRFASYVYIHAGRPLQSLLPHQLATLGSQLMDGGNPVTLLIAWGRIPRQGDGPRETAERWLAKAWQHYERVCGP